MSTGRRAHRDEKSVARSARPSISRIDPGVARCVGHQDRAAGRRRIRRPRPPSGLGVSRLIRFAATRELQLRRPVAERVVAAARDAFPTRDAVIARRILAADLVLLADLDDQIHAAETALGVAAATQPVRDVDLGARLGSGARVQLRCCPWRSATVAGTPSGIPGVGTFTHAVRIRR